MQDERKIPQDEPKPVEEPRTDEALDDDDEVEAHKKHWAPVEKKHWHPSE